MCIFTPNSEQTSGRLNHATSSVGCTIVACFNHFAGEAAATLLHMKDPAIAGLVMHAADLKDRTGELSPFDVEAIAEELAKPLTKN